MSRCIPLLGVIGAVLSSLGAADLASELAAWGPLATSATRSIKEGQWFMHGAGISTSGERMNGLAHIDRDPGMDGEIVIGWARDTGENYQYFPTYDLLRAYLRLGTDPLAASWRRTFGLRRWSVFRTHIAQCPRPIRVER